MNKLFLVALVAFGAFTLPGCRKSEKSCCPAEPVIEMERESGPMQPGVQLEEEDLK